MSTGIPVAAPNFAPAIGNQYFTQVWGNFFDDLVSEVNLASPLADPTFTGTVTVSDALAVTGTAAFTGNIGFFGNAPAPRPTISGSRTSGFALTQLLAALDTLGLITNAST